MKEYLSEDKHNSEASCTWEKERNVASELRQTNGERITQERRNNHLFVHRGRTKTTTNTPLLAETTVLPLSSIALWCRVAFYPTVAFISTPCFNNYNSLTTFYDTDFLLLSSLSNLMSNTEKTPPYDGW